MKEREIEVNGFKVSVCQYHYGSFYYPRFNGNAEFKVSAKGFRQLSHYLRTTKYFDGLMKEMLSEIN